MTAGGEAAAPPVRRRLWWTVCGFGTVALGVCLAAPLTGSTPIRVDRILDRSLPFADNVDAQIFFVARLPRVLAAALVGGALSLAGVVFQALLRNPLASPDTLGVSAGAALGATLAIALHLDGGLGAISVVPVASFTGSMGALAMVYVIAAARRRGSSSTVLLLAGVALSALLLAGVRVVQALTDVTETAQTTRWLLGSLDVASYPPLAAALALLVAAAAGMTGLPRVLDLFSIGAESAAARGVDVERAERVALVSASLATGAAVSLAGPVAFVGIIVPHVVRLLVGPDHRLVLPAAGLFGAAFLTVCDVVARVAMAPVELPVGVVTALVGAPFFLWLLLRRV